MRYVGLDGLRGIAAIAVLAFHLSPIVVPSGYLSVDLFFVISGFVISSNYAHRIEAGMSGRDFLRARINRLGPTFLAGIGLGVAMALANLYHLKSLDTESVVIIAIFAIMNILFIPAITLADRAFPLNSVNWSLWTEAVVNFLYWRFIRILTSRVLVVLMAAGWALAFFFSLHMKWGWSFGTEASNIVPSVARAIPAFACGVLLNRLHTSGQLDFLPQIPPVFGVCLWLAVVFVPSSPLYSLVVCVIVCPMTVAFAAHARNKGPAIFPALGAISYPLYIVQRPILNFCFLLAGGTPDAAFHPMVVLVAVPVCFAAAYAVLRLCEPRIRQRIAVAV